MRQGDDAGKLRQGATILPYHEFGWYVRTLMSPRHLVGLNGERAHPTFTPSNPSGTPPNPTVDPTRATPTPTEATPTPQNSGVDPTDPTKTLPIEERIGWSQWTPPTPPQPHPEGHRWPHLGHWCPHLGERCAQRRSSRPST